MSHLELLIKRNKGMKILAITNSQLQNKQQSVNFKAFNTTEEAARMLRHVKDIKFYSMNDAIMPGIDAYKAGISSPGLGSFLSPSQISVLQGDKFFMNNYITLAEATELKSKHPNDMFEQLQRVNKKAQPITLFKIIQNNQSISALRGQPRIEAIEAFIRSLNSKVPQKDYFLINATKKSPENIISSHN